ncbi:MAG: hypothetical protein AABY11_00125, partial [archaeon]
MGDVSSVPVEERCDHVVMPAPETALEYLPAALRWCKPRGLIHAYLFTESDPSLEQLHAYIAPFFPPKQKWRLAFARKVSQFSARKQQWCVGLRLQSSVASTRPRVLKKSKKPSHVVKKGMTK